ncbi:MAG: 3,4-dihydroxy-2-butanone-4-phosphate synthase [Candidatus ainarchaeum sp.]|nr:3,4-dihydroxy-2-butanone-4-phosphate synthase [Candidatus ainarchaeum sp.]
MDVSAAAEQLRKGGMVVIYDGDEREGEADLVFSAKSATPGKVERLRTDGGGLICAAISKADAKRIALPFLADVLERDANLRGMVYKKTAYGDKPAFSISVNHRDVYTGITDNDRSLTLKKLDEVVRERKGDFTKEFRTPGHVFILIGSGLENRRGHTELALELAEQCGIGGVMVLCEMLGKGKALPKEKAKAYAERNGFIFIEGKEIIAGGRT